MKIFLIKAPQATELVGDFRQARACFLNMLSSRFPGCTTPWITTRSDLGWRSDRISGLYFEPSSAPPTGFVEEGRASEPRWIADTKTPQGQRVAADLEQLRMPSVAQTLEQAGVRIDALTVGGNEFRTTALSVALVEKQILLWTERDVNLPDGTQRYPDWVQEPQFPELGHFIEEFKAEFPQAKASHRKFEDLRRVWRARALAGVDFA